VGGLVRLHPDSPESSPPMSPQRYEIREKLSRGGIGVIFRAFDRAVGRQVAIKRLLPIEQTNLNEPADYTIVREAMALARFQHPNIVTIHSFEQDEDGPFVVMELIDGDRLQDIIEEGAVAVEDFIELARQLLDPLVAAQDAGVLHRDLTPANIMLRWLPSGRIQVKILDFGLAKFTARPQKQTVDHKGYLLGSIDYLAPEQLNLEELDQRVDLYSVGCVLYFALTQRPPFTGGDIATTLRNHLQGRAVPLERLRPDLSTPLADWVMRLIALERGDRPANAREALAEFEGAVIEHLSASRFHSRIEVAAALEYQPKSANSSHPADSGIRTRPVGETEFRLAAHHEPVRETLPASSTCHAHRGKEERRPASGVVLPTPSGT